MKSLSNMNIGYVTFVVVLTIDVTCWSFQHLSTMLPSSSCLRAKERENHPTSSHLFLSNRKSNEHNIPGDDNNKEMDWRDVRAKLVIQYSQAEKEDATTGSMNMCSNSTAVSTNKSMPAITTTTNHRWAYDSGDVIEIGSLIVSHPSQDSACGGLRQQHFHKCIVLVIDHSQETGTKGIILNRPTNQNRNDEHQNDWKFWFGGDTQGIGSEDESLGCLYRLGDSSQVPKGVTETILKDIVIMPWEIAQCLVDKQKADQEDFRLYSGYAKWGPGQLQNELERGDDWFMVATDTESLWDIIVQDSSFSTGTDKWVQIMKRIGKESLISSSASTPNQKFQDDMLKQYVRLKLQLLNKSSNYPLHHRPTTPIQQQKQKKNKRACNNLAPGTLVRSSTPILLDEQVFHQSLVLILQNDDNMAVGIVLNRPYSTSVSIAGKSLPLRYGGRFSLDAAEGEGVSSELWLHCNHQTLQEAKIGEPISEDGNKAHSIFWKCSREDAETAVEVGLANAEDFLVVSGLSVWNKEQQLHISTDEEEPPASVELDDCFSEVDKGSIGTIWKLLKVQEPLNKKNAAENLEAANTAWMLSGDAGWMLSSSSKQFDDHRSSDMDTKEQQVVQSLAYSALDKWIRMYLLKP